MIRMVEVGMATSFLEISDRFPGKSIHCLPFTRISTPLILGRDMIV